MAMEFGSQNFEHHICHFPVPATSTDEKCAFKSLPVDSVTHELEKTDFQATCGKVWAVFLRSYFQSDFISYVSLAEQHFNGAILGDDKADGVWPRSEVVHCHVDPSLSFSKGVTARTVAFELKEAQNMRVNTGLWVSACSTKGMGNQRPSQEIDQVLLAIGLDLVLRLDPGAKSCSMLFAHPHVNDGFADSMHSTFSCILDSVLRQPDQMIQDVPIVSEYNRRQLEAWNYSDPFKISQRACMHHLIEDVIEALPDSEAICSWDASSVTYRQLDELATAACLELRRHGVGPGVYVPIAFEKSMWIIVAMLGILKAGGAFVPLSIDDPTPRLKAILSDVEATLAVTSSRVDSVFQGLVANVVIIDDTTMDPKLRDNHGFPSQQPFVNGQSGSFDRFVPTRDVNPDDPIFVLFTSGSTGQPKGMIHDHRSICAQWLAQGEELNFHKARILQFAAHTFDVFIIDTLTALLFGACICIPSEEDRRSNIIEVINDMRVDYAILTPSFAGLIQPSQVPTLKTLLIGGEALPQDRIQTWSEKVRFTQIYGPAEVGICLTMDMKPVTRPETVGFPLPNASCWLVDPDDLDLLVPPGAVGELIVAGPSIAKGYVKNPAKTQALFIPAPIWAQEMGLQFTEFYKTGDLLRLNLDAFDGRYDFIGRKDSQIKLRGQRIEPGEVEYYLGQMIGVGNVMVTKPDLGPYAGELVAVVEMRNGKIHTSGCISGPTRSAQPIYNLEDVRKALTKHVPTYMLPSAYIEVHKLPQVPSMKIDRRAIQGWLHNLQFQPTLEVPFTTRNLREDEETARLLSNIVSTVLLSKHERLHNETLQGSDFIVQATGIDSIQIISLAMAIRKAFAVMVPTITLLDPHLSISGLAEVIDATKTGGTANSIYNGLTDGHTSNRSAPTHQPHFNVLEEVRVATQKLKSILPSRGSQQNLASQNNNRHDPRSVLLTGSTGYLGRAILFNLLSLHPETRIHLLIRTSDPSCALKAFSSCPEWHSSYFARIQVHISDFSLPDLGLSIQDRVALGKAGIKAIIHAAAIVHYSTAYSSLKAVNVDATLELLALFSEMEGATQFIFVGGGETPDVDTMDALTQGGEYVKSVNEDCNGYTQSKILAEVVVHTAARERLLGEHKNFNVVKPGYIIGGLDDGAANQSDFIWRIIAGCIEIGAYPVEDEEKWIFVSDVDWVAEKVVGQVLKTEHTNGLIDDESFLNDDGGCAPVERVMQGLKVRDLWYLLTSEAFSYEVKSLPRDEWKRLLLGAIQAAGEKHRLWPLLQVLETENASLGVAFKAAKEVHGQRVKAALKRNVEHLIKVGFLPASPMGRKIFNGRSNESGPET